MLVVPTRVVKQYLPVFRSLDIRLGPPTVSSRRPAQAKDHHHWSRGARKSDHGAPASDTQVPVGRGRHPW
jgi:hypothetical protein